MSGSHRDRRLTWLLCLHRVAVRLYPRAERERYGDEMELMLETAWRQAKGLGRLRTAGRALASALVHGALSRFEHRTSRGAAEAPGGGSSGLRARPPRDPRRGDGLPRDLARDFRFGARSLAARPAFTALVGLTLTLGIGVNVSIFSFVNGLLLRPLPYADPGRLLQLTETSPDLGSMDVSYPDFRVWAERSTSFRSMFAFDDVRGLLTTNARQTEGTSTELVEAAVVTPGFLGVLGTDPVLGRDFQESEGRPGGDDVAILSFALWRDRFGGDPSVLGRRLELDGRPRTIVGVAPPGFHFPEVANLWVPLAIDPERADPNDYDYDVIGRLSPGKSLADARSEGAQVAAALARRHPATKKGLGADAYPLRAADVPVPLALAAIVLLAAVCLVLLLACVNVANLLLARGEERAEEIAVHRALGASRGRLLRRLLTEAFLLAFLGGAGGLTVAVVASRAFPAMLPDEVPFWLRFDLDWRVLLWATAATVGTCLVAGLGPALRATAVRPRNAGRGPGRARQLVVVAQVALAMLLLVGAGLMIRALMSLRSVDPGLDPEDVLVLSVAFPPEGDANGPTGNQRRREIAAALEARPEVVRVAATSNVPLLGSPDEVAFEPEEAGERTIAALTEVTAGYFETMGIPLLSGRELTPSESWSGASVVIVSKSVAQRLWPDEDAIGRRLRHGLPGAKSPHIAADRPLLTVVGVVGDVRVEGLGRPPREALYVPHASHTASMTLVAKTSVPPLSLIDDARRQLRRIDRDLAFLQPTTMAEAMAFSTWTERLVARLLSAFGALALILSLVGVHGVVSYLTQRRRAEIGVRLALGGTPASVSRTVASQAATAVATGLVIGALGGVAASRGLASLLHGIQPSDPTTVVAVALLLGVTGAIAAYLPARRAARADPSTALRRGA